MPIDPTRHLAVFSPEGFGNRRVDVIGAGATGSAISLELAKLGVKNLHVWDFDTVEEHNLANQCFGPKHVGMPKVEALKEVIFEATGLEIKAHNEKVEPGTRISGAFVFLLVDSMKARRELGEGCLKTNITTKTCIETRMGTEIGYVYTFNPNSPTQYDTWLNSLWGDDVAQTSACGTAITVGATAKLITGVAIWQFLHTVAGKTSTPNEILISMEPYLVQSRKWDAV